MAIAGWRWPCGFVCPKCAGHEHCIVGSRQLYQCNACRRQTALTAGTIFASIKVLLTTWFRAMYLITQTKLGTSSIEFRGCCHITGWPKGIFVPCPRLRTRAWKLGSLVGSGLGSGMQASMVTAKSYDR